MHGHLWPNTLGKFYVSSANNRPSISTGYNGITGFYWLGLDRLPFFLFFVLQFYLIFTTFQTRCLVSQRSDFSNIP